MPLKQTGEGQAARKNNFRAIITPILDDEQISLSQQAARITAFKSILGPFANISESQLVENFEAEGWDLEATVVRWNIQLGQIKISHEQSLPNRSASQQARERLLASPNVHEYHRRAIDQLYLDFVSKDPADQNLQVTPFRAALLLNDNKWHVDDARKAHLENMARSSMVADIDRRERRLRIDEPNQSEPNSCHRGQRLALFLEILGTDDWVSAKSFLVNLKWDLPAAVEEWLHRGLLSVAPSKTHTDAKRYQAPTEPHVESNDMWAAGRPTTPILSAILPTVDGADWADAAENYKQGAYSTRTGWMINWDRAPARAGVCNPSYLNISYIIKDHGVTEKFKRLIEEGTGTPEIPAREKEFDWMDSRDISALNKWRVQFARRVGGQTMKTTTPFHVDEEQFLYDWHFSEVLEVLAKNDQFFLQGGRMKFDMDKLQHHFNQAFWNTTKLTGTNGKPRPMRTKQSLDMKRRRIQDISEDFQIPRSRARRASTQVGTDEDSLLSLDSTASEQTSAEAEADTQPNTQDAGMDTGTGGHSDDDAKDAEVEVGASRSELVEDAEKE